MPNFTAKLGAFDFAPFLRVTPGDGLDPYDSSGYLEPAFSDGPFAEGQVLVNVDAKTREMAWPLFINTTTSKDALHNLIRDLNRAIQAPKPLRLEWKDDSATNSTFYDVAFARFDPNFNFRQSVQRWAAGVLRVWCTPPYGHTATERIMSSGAGSGAFVVATIPAGSIIGDIGALANYQVTVGSQSTSEGRLLAVTAIPHASYGVRIPAGSLFAVGGTGPATLIGASGAAGSQVFGLQRFNKQYGFGFSLSPASVYAGRNRIIGLYAEPNGAFLTAYDAAGNPLGPTAVATYGKAGGMALVDLGVLNVDGRGGTAVVNVYCKRLVDTQLNPFDDEDVTVMQDASQAGPPQGSGQMNEVFVFPEANTAFLMDSKRSLVAFDTFRASGPSQLLTLRTPVVGAWSTNPTSGVLVPTNVTFAPSLAFFSYAAHSIANSGGGDELQGATFDQKLDGFRILAKDVSRTVASAGVQLYTTAGVTCQMGLKVLSLFQKDDAGNALLVASTAIASSVDPVDLEFTVQGANVAARMMRAGSTVLELTGTRVDQHVAGYVGIAAMTPSGAGADIVKFAKGVVLESLPLASYPAGGIYHLDGTASAPVRHNASDTLIEPVVVLGALPQIGASRPVAIGVFHHPLESAPANSVLSVEVKVRERFQFAR